VRERTLDIVILGLSITSSWGNGHATTYRALVRALVARGHRVLFLERDAPWYAENRDLPHPPYGRTALYGSLDDLRDRFAEAVRAADVVIVGSYVPEGIAVGEWALATAGGLTAFYDIDTPVTLAAVSRGRCPYLSRALIPRYGLYLSFTGGPVLGRVEGTFGAPLARPLYCSVDPDLYYPEAVETAWDLGYLGTYSADRQPALERLMLEAARRWPQGRFVVAGPQYPPEVEWPGNVERVAHLAPPQHRRFYNAQRFTLNLTREAMRATGFAPSVRLFEAAACGTAIISDAWPGLETLFRVGDEIALARDTGDVLDLLRHMPDDRRAAMARRARQRVLAEHTADRRAEQLESYLCEAREAAHVPYR